MAEFDAIEKIKFNEQSASPFMSQPINYIEHPFQKFLDYAVDSLNQVSNSEMNANLSVQKYADGKLSLEEAMFAENQASIDITTAITAVNNMITSFKEIQQMPV